MKRIIKLLCALLCVVLLSGCAHLVYIPGPGQTNSLASTEGVLQVQFLDVGQADCIYIAFPNGENALIDAGNNADGELVADHLIKNGVERLTYLVGTHPHEDHIGGLDDVIEELDIGTIYMPRVADKYVPTTKTYEDVLDAIADKGYKIQAATAGTKIIDTDSLKLEILSPDGTAHKDMNLYSIVLRLDFGDISFLFTGDAEEKNEERMLDAKANLDVDVLKVGHHGSRTSSSKAFLRAVTPMYAVISCGPDNSYGHPHAETVEALEDMGATVYRTDTQGSIVFTVVDGGLSVHANTDIMLDGNGDR